MGRRINGYVSDELIVQDIEEAAKVDGIKFARWVGDACVMRLRNENRLSGSEKARLQLMVGEAVDDGTNVEILKTAIKSAIRESKRKEVA